MLIGSVIVGFGALLLAALAALALTVRTAEHGDRVEHTYQVELAVARARIAIEQTETARRGYLLSADRAYLAAYRQFSAALPRTLGVLGTLTSDNTGQQARMGILRGHMRDLAAARRRTIALIETGQRGAAIDAFVGEISARRLRAIRDTFDAMTAEEQRLLAERTATLRTSAAQFYWVLAFTGLLVALLAVTTLLTLLRYTRDLNRTSTRLAELNEGLEDQVRARTADLTRANEEVQRFAYIVSHDLRSPLVNVMGFTAELEAATKSVAQLIDRVEAQAPTALTPDVVLAAREDLPEAIGFIRAATAKMDRLINAILKLSREGRRVMSPEPIDMTSLVAGIRDSLAHVTEQRRIAVAVEPLPGLTSDRVAVEQIFSNLIENATKYLELGRAGRVEVKGFRDGQRLVYSVVDNGRGIDAKDHARIFDLFRRSGRQDTAGEGIGLAHARALAIRLGGMIDVDSTLGEGATFRVTLPAHLDLNEERLS